METGAHIYDDRLALLDGAVAGNGVGHRAVGAGGHDCAEGPVVGAEVSHGFLYVPGNLLLGHAGLDAAADGVERLVGNADGAAHEVQLVVVLDHA